MPVTCTVVEKATVDMIIRFETLTKLGWIINGIEGCIVGPPGKVKLLNKRQKLYLGEVLRDQFGL
ncbi:MAG: hypothetical protein GY696_23560 [Gammaproteobacteria bacterium]|nr:hypothetical protein [Gammaproteobacteria bacterium]